MAVVFAAVLALAACSADPDRGGPREYRKAIKQAAKECPELTPRLLAAQIDQESGFDPDAVSKAGAEGIAQFVPDTWAMWGQDLDGDGAASPYNAREAIDAQVFGVPWYVCRGEPFWGQDRLDFLGRALAK